jgi:hypothetical protein
MVLPDMNDTLAMHDAFMRSDFLGLSHTSFSQFNTLRAGSIFPPKKWDKNDLKHVSQGAGLNNLWSII